MLPAKAEATATLLDASEPMGVSLDKLRGRQQVQQMCSLWEQRVCGELKMHHNACSSNSNSSNLPMPRSLDSIKSLDSFDRPTSTRCSAPGRLGQQSSGSRYSTSTVQHLLRQEARTRRLTARLRHRLQEKHPMVPSPPCTTSANSEPEMTHVEDENHLPEGRHHLRAQLMRNLHHQMRMQQQISECVLRVLAWDVALREDAATAEPGQRTEAASPMLLGSARGTPRCRKTSSTALSGGFGAADSTCSSPDPQRRSLSHPPTLPDESELTQEPQKEPPRDADWPLLASLRFGTQTDGELPGMPRGRAASTSVDEARNASIGASTEPEMVVGSSSDKKEEAMRAAQQADPETQGKRDDFSLECSVRGGEGEGGGGEERADKADAVARESVAPAAGSRDAAGGVPEEQAPVGDGSVVIDDCSDNATSAAGESEEGEGEVELPSFHEAEEACGHPKAGEEGMPRQDTFLHYLEQSELQRHVMVVVPEGMTENRLVSFMYENKKHDVVIPEGYSVGQEVPIIVPRRPPLERNAAQAWCRGHPAFPDRANIVESLRHCSRAAGGCTLEDAEFKHRQYLYSLLRGRSMHPLLPYMPEEEDVGTEGTTS